MGRRKIEITPITHERNRSVTFLKRKNGLFKKAYELGVLCSVEVAVIIFEERPGHHLKLYQYCSSDVNDVVQRHTRYDGEKDSRGPADFSGNAPNKLDDGGDGDDDDGDDDDQDIHRVPKRKCDGKPKASSDLSLPAELDYSSSLTIPQPSLSAMSLGSSGSSSLPVSSDRHMIRPSTNGHPHVKKPRLMPNLNPHSHSRGSPDESFAGPSAPPNVGPNPYSYHPPPTSYPSRQSQNPGSRHPFFPSQQTPPPNFMPLQPDFMSSPRGHSTSTRGLGAPGYGGHRGSYDQSMYGVRSQQGGGHHHHSGPGGTNDLFAFLDADTRPHPVHPPTNYVGLDWPTSQSGPSSGTTSSASNSESWLDILSGATHAPPPPTSSSISSRESMSWERNDMFGVPPSSVDRNGSRTALLSSPLTSKRTGVNPGHGRLVSPGSAQGSSTASPSSMSMGTMDSRSVGEVKELMVGDVGAG